MTTSRYQRHRLIDWFSQDNLTQSKVAVIGAGAVGNEVIKNLTLLGVGHIDVYDMDTIEEHNLTRSVLFRPGHIGMPKAEVAADQARKLDDNVIITSMVGDFWEKIQISEMKSYNVIFCCVDNFEARIRCNTLCYISGTDLINIGIDSRFAMVESYPFSQNGVGCFECTLPDSVYARISERYSCGHLRKISFIEKKIPTTIITSSIAAGLAVSVGLRLGQEQENREPQRIYVDTIIGSMTSSILPHRPDCPCCGKFSWKSPISKVRSEIDIIDIDSLGEYQLILSEPILVSYKINGRETIIFDKASKFSSDFPTTLTENVGDVELEVRDQFTLDEITRRFAGRHMPCKFAALISQHQKIILEFMEVENEQRKSYN